MGCPAYDKGIGFVPPTGPTNAPLCLVGQGPGELIDVGWQLVNVALWDKHKRSERSINAAADRLSLAAQVRAAVAAELAADADVEVGLGRNRVAGPATRHAASDLGHNSGHLVAEDDGWGCRVLVVIDVDVCPAYSGRLDTNQHVVVQYVRLGDLA